MAPDKGDIMLDSLVMLADGVGLAISHHMLVASVSSVLQLV